MKTFIAWINTFLGLIAFFALCAIIVAALAQARQNGAYYSQEENPIEVVNYK